MNINEVLISALDEIAPAQPWEIDEANEGEREVRRIVFNYDTLPVTFGDDAPVFEKYLIQVHYFCPYLDDTVDVRARIKIALFMAEGAEQMTFPEETAVSAGSISGKEQHYCFECECLMPVRLED